MDNVWGILKKGVNMFKAKKVAAATTAAPTGAPKSVVNNIPGGKIFNKRRDDLKRALNDDFSNQ